jgi:hypothetical protein
VAEVGAALAAGSPERRSRELAASGVGAVVVDDEAPGAAPSLAGRTLHDGGRLRVIELSDAQRRAVPWGWGIAMGGAWVMFVTAVLAGLASARPRRVGTRNDVSGNATRSAERC